MNKPSFVSKKRGVEVVVWGNADRPSISIRKSYKDKQTGEYKESKSLFPSELQDLVDCIYNVQTWIENNKSPEPGTVQHEVLGVKVAVKQDLSDDDIPW